MNFTTRQINLATIVAEKLEFLIPVYQRPYVWDEIEIKKLLEDLKHNFENKANDYFVGNTYVKKSLKKNKDRQFEVIDGQQRFTTFWLISLCFGTLEIDTELKKYLEIEFEKHKDIRFDFDIRKEVYEYLKGLLDGTSGRRFQDVSNLAFLKNIASGIDTIKSFLNSEISRENLRYFGDYIFENVKFVFNEAPENTDLNALFVALGTSGVQLQQSDILKARILDKITEKNQRIIYSKIWEACENMNNFFESNVKLSFPYDTSNISESDFREFSHEKFEVESIQFDSKTEGITISEIVSLSDSHTINNKPIKEVNTECRSIISFNVFLFHVLRIYRIKNGISLDIDSLDPKKLIDSFKIEEIDDVAEFIKLMWMVRYVFDKHVVKWLKDGDESYDEDEKLLLSEVNTSKNEDKAYFSRNEKTFSNLQMLQSLLYFTGVFTQQYWLSPFLYFLIENKNATDEEILTELETIDNIMIPGNKKEMSWQILNKQEYRPSFESCGTYLKQASGVSFNHYWFYKLEYLLWKNWDRSDEKFKRYRITSKNSIEHVFPQSPEYKNQLTDLNDNIDWLNSFGNLALLSVGQNSSYSNQDPEKKKIDFRMKDTYDSLKLAKIYSNSGDWNSIDIKNHQEDMLKILENHYNYN